MSLQNILYIHINKKLLIADTSLLRLRTGIYGTAGVLEPLITDSDSFTESTRVQNKSRCPRKQPPGRFSNHEAPAGEGDYEHVWSNRVLIAALNIVFSTQVNLC